MKKPVLLCRYWQPWILYYQLFLRKVSIHHKWMTKIHGKLSEDIYMKISQVFHKTKTVCLNFFKKGSVWAKTSTLNLECHLWFVYKKSRISSNKCWQNLYIGEYDCTFYLLLYVDDIIMTADIIQKIEEIKAALKSCFHMEDLG